MSYNFWTVSYPGLVGRREGYVTNRNLVDEMRMRYGSQLYARSGQYVNNLDDAVDSLAYTRNPNISDYGFDRGHGCPIGRMSSASLVFYASELMSE